MVDGSLIIWPSASTAGSPSSSDIPVASNRDTFDSSDSSVPRYVLVNDANLKTQAYCAQCSAEIGQHYVRAMGSRSVFCGFTCYCCAAERSAYCFGDTKSANLFATSQRHGETK